MKKFLFILILTFSTAILAQNEVLIEINGDRKITVEEFKRIYLKNNPKADSAFTRNALEEYLNLFTNFKLKVYEAEKLGFDKKKEFKDELQKYRNQLAEPYLVDQSVSEQLYREAYNRMFKAVRASHILIQLPPSPSPSDTLAAYNRMLEIKSRYQKGMPFEQLAVVYSQDPSAKRNFGELGYFSAMRMVYPFETAAFQTPKGEIAGPVRTQFGYHLLKVTDTLTVNGPMDVQFVVVPVRPNDTANMAFAKISLAYEQAMAGVPFSDVVQSFTEDQNSKANNGMLTNYEPGKMSPEFDSVAFRLKEKAISKPFFSRFNNAWFIVYIVKKHQHPTYDEALENIKRRVSRMPHASLRSKKLAERLLAQYKVERNDKAYAEVVDTLKALKTSKRSLTSDMANVLTKPILIINDTSFVSQYEFLRFVFQRLKLDTENLKLFCDENWPEFVERQIINYEDNILPYKYPEFAQILKEYHDGILLFNITDSVVWQRAMIDTVGLHEYFKQISDRYRWNTRYETYVITSEQKEKAQQVEKALKKVLKSETNPEAIVKKVRQQLNDSTLNLRVEKIVVEKGQNRYVDQTKLKKGFYRVAPNEEIAVWCSIVNVIPSQPKKLSEVRGFAIAEYQNYLEKQWIEQLRKKYSVTVHRDVLETLIKK